MANFFKDFWKDKTVGNEINNDVHLTMLHKALIDAIRKNDKVTANVLEKQIDKYVAEVEAKKNLDPLTKSDYEKINHAAMKAALQKQDNPFAICTAALGTQEGAKYESCVMGLKRKFGIKKEDEETLATEMGVNTDTDAQKDVNTAFAGPVLQSGLAAQNLEGRHRHHHGDSETSETKCTKSFKEFWTELNKAKDDKTQWITVGGRHIPIKPGQSKADAISAGTKDGKKPADSKKPSGDDDKKPKDKKPKEDEKKPSDKKPSDFKGDSKYDISAEHEKKAHEHFTRIAERMARADEKEYNADLDEGEKPMKVSDKEKTAMSSRGVKAYMSERRHGAGHREALEAAEEKIADTGSHQLPY